MSELQPQVDALFAEARRMASLLTPHSSKLEIAAYEITLSRLTELWILHNQKTVELLNKCIWKLEENKRKYFDFC